MVESLVCDRCGAPLPAYDGRCDYCGVRKYVGPEISSPSVRPIAGVQMGYSTGLVRTYVFQEMYPGTARDVITSATWVSTLAQPWESSNGR